MKGATIIFALITAVISTITTQSVPILHKERVALHCLNDVMLLSMDLQDIPQIKPSSLHLRHVSCQPHHVTGRTAVFRVPFQGCGTTRGTTNGRIENYITFSNVVENSLPLNISRMIVSHTPKLYYPFSCYYRQKYVITLREGDGNRTGNHNDVKRRREGPKKRLGSVQNDASSGGQARLLTSRIMLAELVLLFTRFTELE